MVAVMSAKTEVLAVPVAEPTEPMVAATPMVPPMMAMVVAPEVHAAAPAVAGPTIIAPIVMMAVTAVAPPVVPVAVMTPTDLNRG